MSKIATAPEPRLDRTRRPRAPWLAPTGLILLSLIPVLAGASRITEVTGLGGAAVATQQNARFLDSPVPVLTHIVSATVFSLVGAFQFLPARRVGPAVRRWGQWHRAAGRILIPAGLLAALSGLWMALFYPHPPGDGTLLLALRLVFGSAMVASIALGIGAIVRRDFIRHGRWMTRAYAIGVAAGTQALLLIPGSMAFGSTDELSRAVLMGAGWVVTLLAAEYLISRRSRPAQSRAKPPEDGDSLRPIA